MPSNQPTNEARGLLGSLDQVQRLILAVLLERLGGEISLTQADFNRLAYNKIEEEYDPVSENGLPVYKIRLVKRNFSA
ncbi:MAG: hypothetical protein E6Q97_36160 [Desulfurellales bacterium]|nr:MAG: hypothetical protein E6Q97_36160 [Desulfurellales bacterium]